MNYEKVAELKDNAEKLSSTAATIRKNFRADGYKNLLNKYGTAQDNSTAYFYEPDARVADMELTSQYESNGLFAKIIDAPAEETMRTGYDFTFDDVELKKRIKKRLNELDFDNKAIQAIKWARLYGGALMVLMIDDGQPLDAPVDWKNVRGIDEILVYERAIVQPDYTSLYERYGEYFTKHTRSKFGEPRYYYVSSINGFFTVHESRCIAFKNGAMPQNVMAAEYRFWGIPEYLRWKRELKDTITTHGNATKLLERSVQAVYKMKDLAQLLATEEGEEAALTRLRLIDMARGFLNTVAIDGEGEDYSFQTFTLSGVKEVVDTTCQMLSAVTEIPQAILFGRSPAGMNATGDADLETYYNFIGRIRTKMIKGALEKVVDILMLTDAKKGVIDEIPDFEVEFESLWSLNAKEQNEVDSQRAQIAQTKATTAEIYINMGVLDPSEVRKGLMQSDEYQIEELLDEDSEEDILTPEERSALTQYKMQNMGTNEQKRGKTLEDMPIMSEQTSKHEEGENAPLNASESAPETDKESIEGDGIIIRDGVVYIDANKLGSIKKRKDTENTNYSEKSLTTLRKCNIINSDGNYALKQGERWVTLPNGMHVVVGEDNKLVWESNPKATELCKQSQEKNTEQSETQKEENTEATTKTIKFPKVDKFASGKDTAHYNKHAVKFGEFGDITLKEYINKAIAAAQVDINNQNYDWYYANVSDDGTTHTGNEREVVIFDKAEGTYLKFSMQKRLIITYFKPAWDETNKKQDTDMAYQYFLKKKQDNGGTQE